MGWDGLGLGVHEIDSFIMSMSMSTAGRFCISEPGPLGSEFGHLAYCFAFAFAFASAFMAMAVSGPSQRDRETDMTGLRVQITTSR